MANTDNTHGQAKTPAKVSVVIPTFNRADMLPTAIDSALAQDFENVEVIVVNHGSSDHTDEVAARYGDRIKYIKRDTDFGPHFCWLDGVMHATGDFVHLQFDDDWIETDFIKECMAVFTDTVGFAFSAAKVVDMGTGEIHQMSFDNWLPATGVYPNKKLERRILRSLISPGAAVYRKQILLDALYQGRLPLATSDYHGVGPDCFVTLLSMLRYPEIGYVKEPLASFLLHDGSITIDAFQDRAKKKKLKRAYKEVKRYYRELKVLRFFRRITGFN
ncbi:glycosyltransferase family 2 protein [Celeribacter sp.]|uniref:glycosyltransferase family 2 protein n=1 Tax=Celeribacter sp. TaxID=1890673 RepID=UPI003A8E3D7F